MKIKKLFHAPKVLNMFRGPIFSGNLYIHEFLASSTIRHRSNCRMIDFLKPAMLSSTRSHSKFCCCFSRPAASISENWKLGGLCINTLSKILKPTSSTKNWYWVLANSPNNLDTATYHWCDSREIFEAHVKEFLWHFSTDILTIVETSSPYKCLIWGRIKKGSCDVTKTWKFVRIYGPSGIKGGGRGWGNRYCFVESCQNICEQYPTV